MGTAGGTHDFGKLTLPGAEGRVEGKVVDSAGQPLANVRAVQCG